MLLLTKSRTTLLLKLFVDAAEAAVEEEEVTTEVFVMFAVAA